MHILIWNIILVTVIAWSLCLYYIHRESLGAGIKKPTLSAFYFEGKVARASPAVGIQETDSVYTQSK